MHFSSPILDRAREDGAWTGSGRLPFEELWSELAGAARRTLLHIELFRRVEIDDSIRLLAAELARIGWRSAFREFELYRRNEESAREAFGAGPPDPAQHCLYDAFVKDLMGQHRQHFYDTYPVVARHLSLRTELFIASMIELAERWRTDAAQLPQARGAELQNIVMGLSDPHNGGRTVARLDSAAGPSLYYKPRPVEMEAGWAIFVRWFNQQDHGMPSLAALPVADRGEYGWMAAAVEKPCADFRLFHERAGMLLALFDLLSGVDFHAGNIVACGDFPMPVDLETLFHPASPWEADPDGLLRTEFLPRPAPQSNGGAYVVCGLRTLPGGMLKGREQTWEHMRTDAMRVVERQTDMRCSQNDARRFAGEVEKGFAGVHRFLRSRRDLWDPEGPVAQAFLGRRSRRIVRATHIYMRLIELEDGLERQHAMERLSSAEATALANLDVPYFIESTGSYQQGAFAHARRRAMSIDEDSLQRRLMQIRQSLA